ncbi:MAG: ABC transporter ATP-binding protein/permease [Prevotella sp.]|nr:ABC transporter ATP-binding protein/permease [Prevotella sp.]MCM1075004.1 ABC transporter ATP-binding protein/permease [Ruminococcus sp.]
MEDFFRLMRRFVAPYKWNVALNIIFNVLAAFLTLFSFAFIIPILQMLFRMNTEHYELMAWGAASFKEVAMNNFYYANQRLIESYGPSFALAVLAVLLVVMTMLKTGTTYLAAYFIIPLRNGVVRDIRNLMYSKILSLPLGFFTNERKGDVMSRISVDVTEIEASVMSSIDMLFKNPIMIVVCLGMMIFVSWQLTVFVLVLLPLAGLVMGKVGKRLKRKSLEAQQQWGVILSTVEETLSGLRIIKAFNAQNKMKNRLEGENQTFFRISNSIQRRYALAHPMSEFLGTTAIAIVLWFGGTLILSGGSSVTAPDFIYYMVIFYSIINPCKELSKAGYSIQKGMASMQRIDKILKADNPIKDPASPKQLPSLADKNIPAISIKGVDFSYNDSQRVLQDIDLDIMPGQTVALVGQSGSGKSTLADLLPRFYDPEKGSISIAGTDIRSLRTADLRSLMGNVNQEAILFNDTIRANIAFGVENVGDEQIERAAKIANAHDFIMATEQGYDTNIGDRGCRLSGGQRQRISIARAILKDPAILILDEATSALDTESERLVQEALERLMQGRTTVVIAHRLSTIAGADLICVMHEGRIIERGTHASLMASDTQYRRLVEMQSFN